MKSAPNSQSPCVPVPRGASRRTRKEFLITAGAGIIAISGYFIADALLRPASDAASAHPRLKRGLARSLSEGSLVLTASAEQGGGVCALNVSGAMAADLMDGTRGIEEISGMVSRRLGVAKPDDLDAKMACFAAQLGAMGFLESPFYAQVFFEEAQS
jgi:hypothetical protein